MCKQVLWIAIALTCAPVPAAAQGGVPSESVSATPASSAPSLAEVRPPARSEEVKPPAKTTQEPSPEGSEAGRFVKDVGRDYKRFFRLETVYWYGGGLAAAGLVHLADEEIREALEDPAPATQTTLEGGDKYGNLAWQVPLAVGWWVTGHALHSSRGAAAGRDLVRAQINATTWAYAWKYAVNRTRPNGDARSFPSGHATAVFATASVLQQHYGWKVGVPFYAGATYTAISRLTINKHWASDVTFGAFVGIASARTVTLHLRNSRFALVPLLVPRGGGVSFVHVG